jgi:hypothetical protein
MAKKSKPTPITPTEENLFQIPVVLNVQAATREQAVAMAEMALKDIHADFGRYIKGEFDNLWDHYERLTRKK